ncbi:hypothetical protein JCM10908_000308 [Rhodotorula pacifica]|uniref:uncharacterized protein n=1 Tax=Rhodotorula pacifica TaxID=1495444 RepID=UPI0031722B93
MASQEPPTQSPPEPTPARPPAPPRPAIRRPSASVTASVAAAMGKPSPFPPLALMLDHRSTVTHALAQSARVGMQGKRSAAKTDDSKAAAAAHQAVEWAPGEKKVKAGLSPGQASRKIFPKPTTIQRAYRRHFIKHDLKTRRDWEPEELEEAAQRGNFPYRPSDLFLKMYSDVLTCLTRDPLAGNVSPALIGSQGTIPLSIVSTIPDIMQHYKDCIVLAEKEVFLVTNYWQPSDSVNTVASGLRELNRRVGERNGQKIVVKIMWDRGAVPQLWHNHVPVTPKTWIPLGVPDPAEVPNLSIQVVNFHRPLLGTFHQKALVVDRRVALLNSNNIQDRPNLEMMVHLEGPIVDSLYDNMLISFDEPLKPTLPCLVEPSPSTHPHLFPYSFTDANPYLADIDVAKAAKAARMLLKRQDRQAVHGEHLPSLSPPEWWRRDSASPSPWPFGALSHHHPSNLQTVPHPRMARTETDEHEGGRFAALVMQLVEKAREEKARLALGMSSVMGGAEHGSQGAEASAASVPAGGSGSTSNGTDAPRSSVADSGVEMSSKLGTDDRAPTNGHPVSPVLEEKSSADRIRSERAAADASLARAEPSPPGFDEPDAPPPTADAIPKATSTGVDGRSDWSSSTAAVSPDANGNGKGTTSSARLAALSKALNAGAISKIDAAIDNEELIRDFKPHLLHKAHTPFPIALVNRRPHGSPGHMDIRCPQAAAWLAALRYAEKNVFIQTPTLNAAPIVRGIVEACSTGGPQRTGIEVTLFLGLGFNDKGESIPFQGGTNEQVVFRLYGQLRKLRKEQNLHVYWYTGKDQIRPLNAVHKSRNCHIKFMSVDGQCAIVGNGNLDSQSFWHSQEANILIDNPQIVADWMDQLRTNQSTHKYGRVDTDGIWRDPSTGEELEKPKNISCFSAMRAVI